MEEVSVFGDPDESKAKMRAQFKKEIEEMNADSEDEHYEF